MIAPRASGLREANAWPTRASNSALMSCLSSSFAALLATGPGDATIVKGWLEGITEGGAEDLGLE